VSHSGGSALQLYGRKKCRETQKGQRWLKERGVEFHFTDLDTKALAPAELDSLARALGGVEALVDTQSALYKDMGYSYREVDLRTELLEHPKLLKTPLLRKAPSAVLGFNEIAWRTFTGAN